MPRLQSDGIYTFVNQNGLITLHGPCDCNEAVAPFVYQDDIYLLYQRYPHTIHINYP